MKMRDRILDELDHWEDREFDLTAVQARLGEDWLGRWTTNRSTVHRNVMALVDEGVLIRRWGGYKWWLRVANPNRRQT